MIPMTKPPNRRLATGAPRRADPLARSRDHVRPPQRCVSARPRRGGPEGSRAGRQRRGPDRRSPRARRHVWRGARFRRQGAIRPGSGLDGRTRRPRPRRRNLRHANQPSVPAIRRSRSRRSSAWRGADARSAYVSLARLRLAQSSRSPARRRPRARQRSGGDRQHALRSSAAESRQGAIALIIRRRPQTRRAPASIRSGPYAPKIRENTGLHKARRQSRPIVASWMRISSAKLTRHVMRSASAIANIAATMAPCPNPSSAEAKAAINSADVTSALSTPK